MCLKRPTLKSLVSLLDNRCPSGKSKARFLGNHQKIISQGNNTCNAFAMFIYRENRIDIHLFSLFEFELCPMSMGCSKTSIEKTARSDVNLGNLGI